VDATSWGYAKDLDLQGVPREEIARRLREERGVQVSGQYLRAKLGTRRSTDPSEDAADPISTTILVRPDLLERARAVALGLGMVTDRGKGAGQGSLSRLIEAIGTGEVVVRKRTRK
jgi:hypothetical protein